MKLWGVDFLSCFGFVAVIVFVPPVVFAQLEERQRAPGLPPAVDVGGMRLELTRLRVGVAISSPLGPSPLLGDRTQSVAITGKVSPTQALAEAGVRELDDRHRLPGRLWCGEAISLRSWGTVALSECETSHPMATPGADDSRGNCSDTHRCFCSRSRSRNFSRNSTSAFHPRNFTTRPNSTRCQRTWMKWLWACMLSTHRNRDYQVDTAGARASTSGR